VELYQYYMLGVTRLFMDDMRGALVATEIGIEQAGRAGHRRAEMIARETRALILIQMGEYLPALEEIEIAVEQARTTASTMFEAMLLAERADALFRLDRLEEAVLATDQCRALHVQPHWWLVGPMLDSLLPWVVANADELDQRATARGGSLEPSSTIMTAFCDARVAEACLERGFWLHAERHAQLALAGLEDVAYVAHLATRVLALLEYQRGSREPELLARLAQLRSNAEVAGLGGAVGLIDRVLAAESLHAPGVRIHRA
jgi:tetratricopeptide (TPR) repeat protein